MSTRVGIASMRTGVVAMAGSVAAVIAAGVIESTVEGGVDEQSAIAIVLGLVFWVCLVSAVVSLCLGLVGIRQRHAVKRPAIVGTVLSAVTLIGALGLMAIGASVDKPTATATKSAEQLRFERVGEATLTAHNAFVRLSQDISSRHTVYNEQCARQLALGCRAIDVEGVDISFRVWIGELIEAADAVVAVERGRRAALADLESGRDTRATELALKAADKASAEAETTGGAIARFLLAGAAGAVVSNIGTDLEASNTNEHYDTLLGPAVATLKYTNETAFGEISKRLSEHYGWTLAE